jgi:hypothetical protein
MCADVVQRGLDVPRLGDEVEVLLCFEQQTQTAAHHRVVVCEDNRYRL